MCGASGERGDGVKVSRSACPGEGRLVAAIIVVMMAYWQQREKPENRDRRGYFLIGAVVLSLM